MLYPEHLPSMVETKLAAMAKEAARKEAAMIEAYIAEHGTWPTVRRYMLGDTLVSECVSLDA